LKLWSNSFKAGEEIPAKYGYRNLNLSPHLAWDEVPDGTKSLALIVDDPDAPAGVWVHWIVTNINPSIKQILEKTVPTGAKQLRNDFRQEKWGGPTPPSGTHRYFFKLYALDVAKLECDERTINQEIKKHKIGEAQLMGKYTAGKK
jgi:Raf kinase inhibitor-like YbhB/YbcL family protein